jgi:putative hemolysin
VQVILFFLVLPAHANVDLCQRLLGTPKSSPPIEWLRKQIVNKTLEVMAALKGLPKYLKQNEDLKQSGRYLEYANFGEMGLAEIGISVRYNRTNLATLNTGRPLIIVANHHLGIADGLTLQYLAGRSRPEKPSLLFLARWIEKLLPHAVYGDEHGWGTAIPVEINMPKESDPDYESKLAEVKAFNGKWGRNSTRALRDGGALIVFPAGHVAAINEGTSFPESVYDSPDSWQDGFLNLARLGKADIVFANVDAVNSEDFYRNRKRFGGGDKERVIWFFSEALAKKGKAIDVYFSKPMSLEAIYEALALKHGHSIDALKADSKLTTELMRQFTYEIPKAIPQELDTVDVPEKK